MYFKRKVLFSVIDGKPQYGAEIAVHPNGKWLYVSNRGQGPLLVYHIDDEVDDKVTLHQVFMKLYFIFRNLFFGEHLSGCFFVNAS